MNNKKHIILSKKLSWLLRHGAGTVGLTYKTGGHLYVDEVLNLKQFARITVEDVQHTVKSNDKKRFELSVEPQTDRLRIRAVNGHSVKIDGLDLTPIDDPSQYPNVIHGTYLRNWESIRKCGLSRMSRTHIHFTTGELNDRNVVSGIRPNVEVVIYIDLEKAIHDGYRFFVSKNGVILTEGNEHGYLPAKYFRKAYQCNPRCELALDA